MDVQLDIGLGGGDFKKSLGEIRKGLDDVRQSNVDLSKEVQQRMEISVTAERTIGKALVDSNTQLQTQKKLIDEVKTSLENNDKAGKKSFNNDAIIKYNSSLKEANNLVKLLTTNGTKPILNKQELSKMTADLINAKDELSALNVILDVTKKKISELDPASKEFQEMTAAMQAAETTLKGLNDEATAGVPKQQNLRTQLKQMTQTLGEMKLQGLEGSEAYTKLKLEAGELADTLSDARDEIRQAGSDTKGFDHLIRTATLVTGGFQIAQGAAALFGAENEEIQKTLLKVTAAMSILNGLQAIQTELTKKDSIVRGIATGVQKAWNWAIAEGTIGLKLFKGALLGTGIGIAIVALGYIIEKMYTFGLENKKTTKTLEQQKEALENYKKAVKETVDEIEALGNASEGGLNQRKRELELLKAKGASEAQIFSKSQEIKKKELANLEDRLSVENQFKDDKLKIEQDILDKKNEIESEKIEFEREAHEKRKALNKDVTEFIKKEEETRVNAIKDSKERELADLVLAFENEVATVQDAYDKIIKTQRLSKEQRESLDKSLANQLNNIAAEYAVKSVELEQKHNEEILNIKQAAHIAILQLQGKDKEAEIAALDDKYADIRETIKKAGRLNTDVEREIEDKKRKDKQAIDLKFGNEELDKQEELEIAKVAILTDNKYSPAFMEELKQKEVLRVQLKYAKMRLDALQAIGSKENELAIAQTKKLIFSLEKELQKSEDKGKNIRGWLAKSLGIAESDLEVIENSLQSAISSMQAAIAEGIQANIDARQKEIDALDDLIDEKESELDREIDLATNGYANNRELKERELEELKARKKSEIDEQKKAQKELAKIELANQVASLGTAATSIIQAGAGLIKQWTAAVPLVGAGIGLALAGTLVAGFFGLKSRIKQIQSLGEGGVVGGKKHSQGGNKYVSMDGNDPSIVEIEAGERVTNARSSKKYDKLLDVINKDDLSSLTFNDLMRMVSPNDIKFDSDVPRKVVALQSVIKLNESSSSSASSSSGYLKEIADTNREIAISNKDILDLELGKPEVERRGNNRIETYGNGKTVRIIKNYYND